jgi:hypothetical protein
MTAPDMITNTNTSKSNEETWSGEDRIYDYLTITGLNTKFGLNGKDYDIFTIQQVIDNALDFIEQNAKKFVNGQNPYVSIIITEEEDGKVTKIRVRNSNAGISNLFPQEHIDKIFKLDRYQSSKRYRYKINRGELGDAFKAILGIPYALVIDNDDYRENWDYPLEVNILNDNRSIKIKIDNIDKIRRRENPKVIQQEYYQILDQLEFGESESKGTINNNNNFTEVVVYLPEHSVDYGAIHDILKKYIIDNTHINFSIQLPGQKDPRFYKATQELSRDWKNKQSIYSYTLQDIKGLFYSIDKTSDNLNVFDNFIRTDFREGTTLKKDKDFKILTFDDLRKDDKKIEQIVQKLKNNQKPIKYQSTSLQKLEAPFDWKLREQALKERLKQVYDVEGEDFIYKRFDKYYENANGNGVQFPYKLEVVIANSPILEKNVLTLIESLNFSPSLNSDLFSTNDSIFFWKNYKAENILGILLDCGYSIYNNGQHKKPYNLIFVNLISPRIDYNNFSKSNINLLPFAEMFSNEFYKFCKFASTKRIKNNGGGGNGNGNKNTDNRYYLRIWLKERLEAVKRDPTLLTTGRVTLDGVYYRLRTKLDRMGIPVKERSHIKSSIKDICDEMGYKRDELGIIAAERAQFYFRGRSYGVGIDEISKLAQYATDLIIIEKEGAVEALSPFADMKGIALVYTRGFGTEYALELSEQTESNIAVLTDLDASGLLIAAKLPSNKTIHRIGIDQQMLDYFGLDFDDLSETYIPQEGHYDTVAKYLRNNNYNLISNDLFKRLRKERIEIDSVLSKVSNEDLWNYIIEFLEEKFPNRNYNRSIDVPEYIMPYKLEKFITTLNNRIRVIQTTEREKIIKELENVEGFIEEDNIEQKEEEINDRLMSSVAESDQEKIVFEEFHKKFSSSSRQ